MRVTASVSARVRREATSRALSLASGLLALLHACTYPGPPGAFDYWAAASPTWVVPGLGRLRGRRQAVCPSGRLLARRYPPALTDTVGPSCSRCNLRYRYQRRRMSPDNSPRSPGSCMSCPIDRCLGLTRRRRRCSRGGKHSLSTRSRRAARTKVEW